jgi:drug/metabolite transporter (DMT)-like permease
MNKIYNTGKNMTRIKAILLLAATALLWSLGGVFVKLIDWNSMAIAGVRSAFTALLLWVYLRKPKFNWSRDQVLCAFAYALTVTSYVAGTKLTAAANVILLQYTAPIYVALFGFAILKERTTKADWITTGIVIAGMGLFFMDELDISGVWGNILGIISGIGFATVTLLMRKQKDGSSLESILLGNIITAAVGLPFVFGPPPAPTTWIVIIVMAILQLGLPYILYSIAMKSVKALEAVLISVLEPLVNPIWVYLMVGEIPGKWSIIGGIIVLVAVTLRCVVAASNADKISSQCTDTGSKAH